MSMQSKPSRSLQIKFEVSEIEHDIQRMQVDLEFSQKQGLLIRQTIDEKQQRMENLIRRLERMEQREVNHESI
jgi:hypothetical protein